MCDLSMERFRPVTSVSTMSPGVTGQALSLIDIDTAANAFLTPARPVAATPPWMADTPRSPVLWLVEWSSSDRLAATSTRPASRSRRRCGRCRADTSGATRLPVTRMWPSKGSSRREVIRGAHRRLVIRPSSGRGNELRAISTGKGLAALGCIEQVDRRLAVG